MVGWHPRLDGCEFEQAPGVGDGQGSLVCYSPWSWREKDTTERLNNNHPVELGLQGPQASVAAAPGHRGCP